MARPSPNTVDYFPHYAKTGKTKTVLKQKFGHVGIACWWELLEILAKSENHFYDAENDLNWHYLLSVLDVSEDVANEFFDLLAILGNIDKDLWTSKKVIWCQNFCDNISYVYAKRRKETPSKPTFCDKNTTIRDRNSNTDGVSVTETRQREMEVEMEVEVKQSKNTYSDFFEKFWDKYPGRNGRKVGKSETFDAIKKYVPIDRLDDLDNALNNYIESKDVKNGYAKDPKRFIKNRDWSWEDWIAEKKTELPRGMILLK